ncbi:MAG TPA: DUF4129 domain-containing protein [Gemmatimonadaceae bacterium]|nr:DUF4129 domain-containing protein [Gemmatimonadaceae bacterium]
MRQAAAAAAVDGSLDPAAVRDTIASVFTHPAYDQSLRQSIGDRVLEWIVRILAAVVEALRGSADLRWLVIGTAVLIVAVILGRAAFLTAATTRRNAFRSTASRARGVDAWAAAAVAAKSGRYTDAAHLLYAAVLDSLAGRHRVVLHHAKTAGEYEHDLRTRHDQALPAFVAFNRAYERAIWGARACDENEYNRMLELAASVASGEPGRVAA